MPVSRAAALLVPLVVVTLAATACIPGPTAQHSAHAPAASAPQELPYDVRPLIQPPKKYFGVSRP